MAVNSRALRQPSSSHVQSVVLLHDGIKVHTPPVTAQEFLGQYRSYSYTTALVRDKYHVVDWRLHLERLLRYRLTWPSVRYLLACLIVLANNFFGKGGLAKEWL